MNTETDNAALACAKEIAAEYTFTKCVSGIAEIIERHFPSHEDKKMRERPTIPPAPTDAGHSTKGSCVRTPIDL